MTLQELLEHSNLSHLQLDDNLSKIKIEDIVDSSNQVTANSLFVAIVGYKVNGVDFVEQAIKNGAVAVIVPTKYHDKFPHHKNIIAVDNTRKFLAMATFYLYADIIPKNIFTVTGTNGKTSVVNFVSQILKALKINNMTIGTIGVDIGENHIEDSMTTPSTMDIVRYFKIAKQQQIDYVIIENSSHGIEQYRLFGLHFKVVGFTNLTQDHFDYYHNLENYFQAKLKLFTEYQYEQVVLNTDDNYGKIIKSLVNKTVITYGKTATGLKLNSIVTKKDTMLVSINYQKVEYSFSLKLIGEFQVYNVLCAIGLLLNQGISFTDIVATLPQLKSAIGRMLLLKLQNGGKIFIDYAHTPNALEVVLQELAKDKPNKLKVLFGCGGNRDTSKRAKMGQIATRLADVLYITDDNPRFEDALAIRQEIITGGLAINPKAIIYNIDNRKQAIEQAIRELADDEILLIAGRGHEQFHIIGEQQIPLSDIEVAQQMVETLKI